MIEAPLNHGRTRVGTDAGALNERPQELLGVQYLRAIAAIMVVFHHAHEQFAPIERLMPTKVGESGVDLFFVISGFIMVYTTAGRDIGPGRFILGRIQRIVPLYWTMTLVTAALLIAAPTFVRNSVFSWPDLVASLTFFPKYNAAVAGSISPTLKLGWTLNYEMYFYVLFAVTLWLRPRFRTIALVTLLAAVCTFEIIAGSEFAPFKFWGNILVFEFALGCGLALAMRHGALFNLPSPAVYASGVIALICLFVLANSDLPRLFTRGVPSAVILAAVLHAESKRHVYTGARWLHFLGDASYSIYLAHLYAVILFRVVWMKLSMPTETPASAIAFVSLCIIVGTLGGVACHLSVERPLSSLAKRALAQRSARAPMESAPVA